MKKLLLIAVGACLLSVDAETYTWTNAVAKTGSWTNNVENWVDSQGSHPAKGVGPAAGLDTNVAFVPLCTNYLSTINWDGLPLMSGWNWSNTSIGSVSYESDHPHRILNIDNGASTVHDFGVNITIGDPTGFKGFWKTSHGQVNLILPATEGFVPELANVSLAKRLDIEVPNAGTSAKVLNVYEGGVLVKRGNGELEVDGTAGSAMQVHVSAGTLTLAGRTDVEDTGYDLPVQGAWLHLDATATNTMYTCTEGDGRLYVTNWPDVRGNGLYAYYDPKWKATRDYLAPSTHAPFLNTSALGGMPVMDFGAHTNSAEAVAAYGPAYSMLWLSQSCSKVREAFFVGAKIASRQVPIFGASSAYHFCAGSGNYVFNWKYSSPNVIYGSMLLDGDVAEPPSSRMSTYTQGSAFKPSVISVAATNNVTVELLGSDRFYRDFSGGIRICEVILFTNVLTQTQRTSIHRHLEKKWSKTGYLEDVDVGVVTMAASTALGVKDGATAKVQDILVADGTLVKTGEGTLEVGTLSTPNGASPKIDVRGGKVEFAKKKPIDDTQPAADPYLWLDPNDYATRMTISNITDNVTNYVAEWRDHRADHNDVYAHLPSLAATDYNGVMPYLVPNAANGLTVVDFADYGREDKAAYMRLNYSNVNTANAYEAFLVQAYKTSSAMGAPFFGNSANVTLLSTKSTMFLDDRYGDSIGRTAFWTLNGVPVDPMAIGQAIFKAGELMVGSVSAASKIPFTLLGVKDRLGGASAANFGGVQMGEYLLYDRKLTPAERRQTIAYLMKRWLGRSPSYAAETEVKEIREYAFPPEQSAVLDTSVEDMHVKALAGSDGTLVKKGNGFLKVGGLGCPDLSSITVEEGSMTLDFTLSQTPAYHLDATKTASLTTEEWTPEAYENQPASDTVMRTNVTAWADADGNGVVADYDLAVEYDRAHAKNGTGFINRRPTLRMVETAAGVRRPMVDFGSVWGGSPGHSPSDYGANVYDTSALIFNKRFINDDALSEFFTVFAEKEPNRTRQALIGNRSTRAFCRGEQNLGSQRVGAILDAAKAAADARKGYVSLDGVQVEPTNTVITKASGVHVVSFATLSPQPVDSLAYDGSVGEIVGGCRFGEHLAFKDSLSTNEHCNIVRYMMHKWFETPWTFYGGNLRSIELRANTTLTVTGALLPPAVEVGSLAGAGTLVASNVTGVAALDVLPEEGPFTVDGKVTFAAQVAVNVFLSAKPEAGDYPIFSATELVNVDLSAWTINVQSAVTLYRTKFALKQNGNTIFLRVLRPGIAMSFR